MAKLLVINGPNLNLLGQREPEVYGTTTLDEINTQIRKVAEQAGHQLTCFQSNAEHELIETIQSAASDGTDFIIINPGAFTHTSIALRDALAGIDVPFIEVHLSNVFSREEFRRHSYLSDIAVGIISGLGSIGYQLAIQAAENYLAKE